jgi:nucleoid DNA-binding protein
MNKSELIKKIASESDLTQNQVAKIIESTVQLLQNSLIEKGHVSILGLGRLSIKQRKSRIIKRPLNGMGVVTDKPVTIAAKNIVQFSPATVLLDAVNLK